MKIYNQVKLFLQQNDQCRNSDKHLYWKFIERAVPPWKQLDYEIWMKLPEYETVRRTRQKIQEENENLGPTSDKVRSARKKKQDTKGTFIYREES